MSHIHELIDFTVSIFIVYNNKVLLIDHKELKTWLPIGGHIELDEDPEQALFREIQEECGLEVEVLAEKPNYKSMERKFLYTPSFLDIHQINKTHKHIALVYFGKSNSDKAILAKKEHYEIRWFTDKDLDNPRFKLKEDITYYSREAFKRVR